MGLSPDLAASLAAGEGLLVPDRAAAVSVRLAFAAEQRRRGSRVWSTPKVLTPAALLRECAAAENQPLMTSALEWGLLRQLARDSADHADGPELSQANALADAWQRSLTLLRDHGIAPGTLQTVDTPESRWLLRARDMLVASAASWGGAQAPSIYFPRQLPANNLWRHAGFSLLPRAWRALLTEGAETAPQTPSPDANVPLRHVGEDPTEEVTMAFAWARRRLGAGQRVLVMVPPGKDYEPALQRSLHSLARLDAGRDAAVLLDRRVMLAERAWVRDVLFVIGWLCEDHEPDAILRGLQSGGSDVAERAMRAQLAAWYRQQSAPPRSIAAALGRLAAPQKRHQECDWSEVRAWLAKLESCRSLLGETRERRTDWPERFAALSTALPFAMAGDAGIDARRLQQAWQELLQEAGLLVQLTGPVSCRAQFALLAARAARTPMHAAVADSRLHVLRSRRDPLLAYDAIWVCGLSASQWPDAVAPDGWVPRSVQMAASVAAADAAGRLREAERLLTTWRRACGELRVSQPARLDDARTTVSPLLRDFPAGSDAEWNQRIATETPPLVEYLDESFSGHIQGKVAGGASLLDHYNDCPFRGSAEQRLALSTEEDVSPGLDPLESGSQLHQLLQQVWGKLKGSEDLRRLSHDQTRQLVENCIAAVLGGPQDSSDARRVATQVQRRLLLHRVESLLHLERTRSPFRVTAREETLQLSIAGCQFGVRIDRIDELLDDELNSTGRLLVIDYKSGASGRPNWKSEHPRYIQLLLYRAALLAQERDPVGLVTWHLGADSVKAGGATDTKFLPRSLQPALIPKDWVQSSQSWSQHLQQIADGLWQGRADLQPLIKACEHCPLPALCRRDARLGATTSGDDDAGE